MIRALLQFGTALLLTACGGSADDPPATTRGVQTVGAELFAERVIGANPGCVTCHSLEPGATLVGPSLNEVRSPVEGLSAAEYVRESIVDPDAYVGDGYRPGQMTAGWDTLLTDEQIESLVAFLTGS